MADSRRYGLTPQLDIEQILLEAQHRWLRPAEICEILRNYIRFHIAPEAPNTPTSGSLFLFDRKVLRYFRKDGHNWRKKKDGKTVKEAHERLKSGSVDVLHCYYAHGEENENFQRRSYWMLEEDLMHIVLVHYLEVKGNKSSFSRTRDVKDVPPVPLMGSPVGSSSITNQSQLPSQVTGADSFNSATSEHEDAESDNYQRSSRYHPHTEMQQYDDGSMMGVYLSETIVPLPSMDSLYNFQDAQASELKSDFYSVAQEDVTTVFDGNGLNLGFSESKTQLDLTSWDETLEHCTTGFQASYFQPSVALSQGTTAEANPNFGCLPHLTKHAADSSSKHTDDTTDQSKSAWQPSYMDPGSDVASSNSVENSTLLDVNVNHVPTMKKRSLDLYGLVEGEGFKKYDSFSRWMSKELEEVDDSYTKSSSGAYWNDIGSESTADPTISNHEYLDSYLMSPSLSQDQLFSIVDFSPTWAYAGLGTKVLVIGTFLKDKEVEKCKWSCMFGETEVPVEVLADGTLRCCAPPHKAGKFPFYVTCSNRLACSEVREFEFCANDAENMNTSDLYNGNTNEILLHIRLDKLLSLGPNSYGKQDLSIFEERAHLISKISSAIIEADVEWSYLLKLAQDEDFSPENAKDQMLGALLRDKLHSWLVLKVAEDGKGPSIVDEEGQGVLHLAAALGYNWAIKPTVISGVNINFRDVHGWTALHWAASWGRERTVAALIAMGAAPGALTDPTPDYPSGRTPADLASANGHKGIAGFLAESSLTTHLSALTLFNTDGSNTLEPVGLTGPEDISKQDAIQIVYEDTHAGLSLKDSLTAVRNASQAAARIYQMFRIQSFHRKKLIEYGNEKYGISDEHALSFVSVKSAKSGQYDMPMHSAAIRIQNKFRGWKGRKDFLVIRQRIVKIQAHVRGHHVRKHYRKILWSVGIVEKAILRWRRKGSGLRGFRSEGLLEGHAVQNPTSEEDNDDFLQEGKKQTEARLQKALERVKSMVQYPEARDQYRRILTIVAELEASKAMQENAMNEDGDAGDGDFIIELQQFCEDEAFTPTA